MLSRAFLGTNFSLVLQHDYIIATYSYHTRGGGGAMPLQEGNECLTPSI